MDTTELHLRHLFPALDVDAMLLTPRYWHLASLVGHDTQAFPAILREIAVQQSAFESLRARIARLADRIRSAPGAIALLDTNTLLHFQLPDSVDWCSVIGRPLVRLVVPLRAIEELDAKKYARRDDLAGTAREVLTKIDGLLASTVGAPVPLRDSVTIEIPVDDEPRARSTDADEEILDECERHRDFATVGVTLVTGDTAMGLRAQARRICVKEMPRRYLRRRSV